MKITYEAVGEVERAEFGNLLFERVGDIYKWTQSGPVKSLRAARVFIKRLRSLRDSDRFRLHGTI